MSKKYDLSFISKILNHDGSNDELVLDAQLLSSNIDVIVAVTD